MRKDYNIQKRLVRPDASVCVCAKVSDFFSLPKRFFRFAAQDDVLLAIREIGIVTIIANGAEALSDAIFECGGFFTGDACSLTVSTLKLVLQFAKAGADAVSFQSSLMISPYLATSHIFCFLFFAGCHRQTD
jgi:hypothetical protein